MEFDLPDETKPDLTGSMRNGIILMDGGTGHDVVPHKDQATIPAFHREHIAAGAAVLKTRNGCFGDPELGAKAAALAWNTRHAAGKDILIAGCLPAPDGEIEFDTLASLDALTAIYRDHVRGLGPFVDFYLCGSMRNSLQATAAVTAAASTGKPIWVSWKLKDNLSATLPCGETLAEAWQSIYHLPVAAVLVNCCDPESVTAAMPELKNLEAHLEGGNAPLVGGYANGFSSMARKWTIKAAAGAHRHTRPLDPDVYARHVKDWIDRGADIVGGCCGVGPAHIARIDELIEKRGPSR